MMMTSNLNVARDTCARSKTVASYQPPLHETLAACTVSRTTSGVKSTYWFTSAPLGGGGHLAPNPNVALPFIEELGLSLDGDIDALLCITSRLSGRRDANLSSWPAFISKGTLFLKVPNSDCDLVTSGFGFKESVAAVLELAEEVLDCSNVVICLDKGRPDLAQILRAFLFVGFEIVHPSVYNFSSCYVLVGQSF
ncbi:Ornithine decarboxylase antizyme 1 [Dinochytrium kinnereticum]|nr:Ornithine decarboxylase antizyme 1 [Dinochytrium kinnereticum]